MNKFCRAIMLFLSLAAISILPACKANSLTKAQLESSHLALSALKEIQASVSVGTSYVNYGPRLVTAKLKVDEAVKALPKTSLSNSLSFAFQCYLAAGNVWSHKIEYAYSSGIAKDSELYKLLKDGFGFDPSDTGYDSEKAMQLLWKKAEGSISLAEMMIDKNTHTLSEKSA